MKHVSSLINLSRLKTNRHEEESRDSLVSEETAHVVNLLFRELKSIFPAFRQAWPTDEEFGRAKSNWVKAFQASGICRIEQLKFGIEKCRISPSPFAPSAGQFILWCSPSPEDLGFPSPDEAYSISILMNRQFSDYCHDDERVDTTIRHAIRQIGSSIYREMNADNSRKVFKNYYGIALKQFLSGELKAIPKSLPEKSGYHPSDKARSDEARNTAMKAIRRMGINYKRTSQNESSKG